MAPDESLARAGKATSVLVVDDDPAVLRVTSRVLRAAGMSVTECADGAAAIALLESATIDVVVSDIDMPGLTGIALLKLLRARGIEVPVILMTGAPALDTAVEAVELGAFKYLMKPVAPAELCATVQRATTAGSGVHGRSSQAAASPPLPASGPGPVVSRAAVSHGLVLADRYRLLRQLGEGGMSQVWEATQIRTGRQVAVKLLHASLNARPEMRERLIREARAASQVGHPSVVDVLDAFELFDGTPVLVMALLRGRTLEARLAQDGPLPLREAAIVLLPVVSAVGTAHARGVIHRDLKPENIFLSDEGDHTSVKVLDFGIARLIAADGEGLRPLTATGALVGTPGYMAPEQGLGEHDIDARADVWSMGAIVYRVLSGVHPVQADNVGQMLKALFTESIVPLSSRVPETPSSLASLVDRMLAVERNSRPHDLQELFVELGRHAPTTAPSFGAPSGSPPAPVSESLPKSEGPLAYARTEYGDD
jgi:eukaryotic-like serine/threonine-protein kinase